jgi:hypothetical protein
MGATGNRDAVARHSPFLLVLESPKLFIPPSALVKLSGNCPVKLTRPERSLEPPKPPGFAGSLVGRASVWSAVASAPLFPRPATRFQFLSARLCARRGISPDRGRPGRSNVQAIFDPLSSLVAAWAFAGHCVKVRPAKLRLADLEKSARQKVQSPSPVANGKLTFGDPEDKLCPDCREQNAPDDDDGGDGADLGLGIL